MMKKTLKAVAFSGRARKDGNTAILVRHALDELGAAGVECEFLQLAGKKAHGCLACGKCAETRDGNCAGIRDYIPRPFLDEELVIRVHRVAAPQPATNPGLRGSLVDIGLGTLMSLFEFERKSGVLLVLRHGEIARVFVISQRNK